MVVVVEVTVMLLWPVMAVVDGGSGGGDRDVAVASNGGG